MSTKEAVSLFRKIVNRATAAVIVASIVVIAGMAYCINIGHTDGILMLSGAGIGFLLKELT